MQGHRSTIGSLPDPINLDSGSSSSSVGIDQQICWSNLRDHAESRLTDCTISAGGADTYRGPVVQEAQNMNRWLVGEPGSSSTPDVDNHNEPIMQNGWPSSMTASSGMEAQCYQPTSSMPRNNINLNLDGNHHFGSGSSYMPFHSTGSSSQNYDLNVGPLGRVGGDHMECFTTSDFGGAENKLVPSGSNSSVPFSSAISGGFLVEDEDSRPGCSLDGRRLSCKRKAFEGHVGQSSGGECGFSRENTMWPDVSPYYDAGSSMNTSTPLGSSPGEGSPDFLNPRLGLGMGGPVLENHTPIVAGGVESSQRNHRLRVNSSNQQDSLPNHSYLSMGSGHSGAPTVHQPLRLLPVSPHLDSTMPMPPDNAAVPSQSFPLRLPSPRHTQALSWNASPSILPASSSAIAALREADALLNDDLGSRTTRNISEHPIFSPAIEGRSSTHNPRHWSSSGGNPSRNAASSSRGSQGPGSHFSAGPSWAPRRSQSQYSRRLSEYVRRSLLPSVGAEAVARGHNILAQRFASGSSPELPPSGSGSQGHSHSYPQSALWMERQGDGGVGAPYSLRALAAAGDGRSRLVSEIRNVLDIMRRGEALRLEDVMILDQTVLFGMADIHDQHRDMRLDVDNMSYEELLALEERIGNVCTGLSEETVLTRMKQRIYLSSMSEEQMEMEPCCICREIYNDGEELGTLDCGHDFHTGCIKQWLAQKNLCPICKTTALST